MRNYFLIFIIIVLTLSCVTAKDDKTSLFASNNLRLPDSESNNINPETSYDNLEIKTESKPKMKIKIQNLPIAVFHGIDDNCDGWMKRWTDYIGEQTNTYAKCIESGADKESLFSSIQKQSEKACQIINSDPNFHDDFVIVGFSQGGLISRYITEKCEMKGTVKKLITLGTPHMGVEDIPCNSDFKYFCNLGYSVLKYLVYTPFIDNLIAPVAYIRTPSTEYLYRKYNKFLAHLNNESYSQEDAENNKSKFINLDKLVLIKFNNDDLVMPKESAWFEKYDKFYNVESLISSEFYINDYLGLRHLNENKKVKFYGFQGKHMELSKEEIDLYVVNELLN